MPDPAPEQRPTPEQREYAELLLERAKSDLGALRVLMADEGMLDDVVGFHAQQAIEKALKARADRCADAAFVAVAEKVADLESTVPEDTVGRGKIVASPEVTMLVLTHIGLGDAE